MILNRLYSLHWPYKTAHTSERKDEILILWNPPLSGFYNKTQTSVIKMKLMKQVFLKEKSHTKKKKKKKNLGKKKITYYTI